MKFGKLPGINKPISRLVQGTVMLSSYDQETTNKLLDAVVTAGINTFDTAHGYGMGQCERAVGAWLNERGNREELVILGKGAHPYDGRVRVTPEDITSDIAESLERLQTDYIDLYVLHRDDVAVPIGPLMDVLNDHLKKGVIKAIGGSNWTTARLAEANAYAAANGLTPMQVSSPNFSLAEQSKEPWDGCTTISGPQYAADRAWYAEQKMPLFTWSSLAGGFFSGRFRPDNLDSFENYFDKLCAEVYCYGDNWGRLDRAKELAARKGASLAQIAIAYVLNQPFETYALVAAWKPEEAADSVKAAEIELTAEEIAWLEKGVKA
ncbi:MAG: aryl-alcohol dehydrogenase-like predicted oxidoreductase [Candidatus Promineifilaceae bacterium]|jgi:aryl-alcohol dehydrogenase-like predicted oxidoreductase